jgi:hypothetical protein
MKTLEKYEGVLIWGVALIFVAVVAWMSRHLFDPISIALGIFFVIFMIIMIFRG